MRLRHNPLAFTPELLDLFYGISKLFIVNDIGKSDVGSLGCKPQGYAFTDTT